MPNALPAFGGSVIEMRGQKSSPVCIVCGGPVGLCLALFLYRMGVRSTDFNTEKTTRWHPKGRRCSSVNKECRQAAVSPE